MTFKVHVGSKIKKPEKWLKGSYIFMPSLSKGFGTFKIAYKIIRIHAEEFKGEIWMYNNNLYPKSKKVSTYKKK